jgi:hypothetical protein
MSPEALRDLADDIAAQGLREPATLTPDGQLLDGRNRTLACLMAGAVAVLALAQQAPPPPDHRSIGHGRSENSDAGARRRPAVGKLQRFI